MGESEVRQATTREVAGRPPAGHGPRRPTEALPARRPGSVRRTAVTDILRPEGLEGVIELLGSATDVLMATDGADVVLGGATVDAAVDPGPRPTVLRLSADPARPALGALVGGPAMSGLRGRARTALPAEFDAATPLGLLLDDLPVCVLISGYASASEPPVGRPGMRRTPPADVCSGWRSDGAMMTAIATTGALPLLVGPPAPALGPVGDRAGGAPDLARQAMRRRRWMDLRREAGDLLVESGFRDSYRDSAGTEQIVHEYLLSARVRESDLTVVDIAAEPRVLPWQECPWAAASAGRLVGRRVGTFREHVADAFTGTTTCTHLNDLLRSLDDVAALRSALAG